MCPPVSLARHFVNKFLAARCSVAVGELAVETRRHQRERGEKVCSQHPARETLTLVDRPLPGCWPTRQEPAPHPPMEPAKQNKRQKCKNTKLSSKDCSTGFIIYKVATFSRRQKPSLPGNLDFIRTKPDCQLV